MFFLCNKMYTSKASTVRITQLMQKGGVTERKIFYNTKRTLCVSQVHRNKKSIRIGCASGFWGDTATASNQLVHMGNINYLVFDYLSEITMSLLTAAKRKNPDAGFAPDFVHAALLPNLAQIMGKNMKVISNAGGINPLSCGRELAKGAEKQGVKLEVAVVTGDDMMKMASKLRDEVVEMHSGKPMPESIVSINAYFGAEPIRKALDLGAQVVITGRCVDSAIVLGPLMHEFQWSSSDYDRLAAGSLAGHLVECGAQATGGIFTDWQKVADMDNIGFPIVDCQADGSFTLTKPPKTGGLVTPATVAEQLTYEIGDPSAYILPQVSCDFRNASIESIEHGESVAVRGARGNPPTDQFKVCATYMDGFRLTAVCCIGGKRSIAKGCSAAEGILKRVRRIFKALGMADFARVNIQVIGEESLYGKHARSYGVDGDGPRETMVWIAVEHKDKKALEILAREIAPAGTGMAPGLSGIVGGRPKVSPILKLYSFLYHKNEFSADIYMNDEHVEKMHFSSEGTEDTRSEISESDYVVEEGSHTCLLEDIAYTRSGDKGNSANIGVIARDPEFYPYIGKYLTEEAVFQYFQHLFDSENTPDKTVTRYPIPGIHGFNFVLRDCLGGGGVASLRTDPQGKALGQMLLDLELKNLPDFSKRKQ